MKTRLLTLLGTVVTIASLAVVPAGTAAASDIPDTAVADSVSVHGRVTATGYTGWGWWRDRVTETANFHGSELVPTPSRFQLLANPGLCAGDLEVYAQAFVDHRRDDGWVRVSFGVWTWDDCPLSGHHGSWEQRYAWVAPGESSTIDLSTRSDAGAVTAFATFTNHWTPKIDTSELAPSAPLAYSFGF